jgi:1,6-anhydro-N-acetylmuramate kinase
MARATAIGLMSGTSYDGVDVALIETDGEEIGRLGPTGYRPYSDPEREVVRRAIAVAANLTDRNARPAMLAEAEELVTDMHAEAVEAFLAANGMPPSEVAVVGFHGQTVLHRPDRGLTIQLGNGAALAGRLGIPVVYDFRAADVAAGGHGAPMVPVFHRAMLRLLKRAHPVGVLNLGGVANITFINGGAELVACDTGPGNALIDDFVRLRTGQPQDDEGRAAAAGKVDEAAVARVLKHPFFATPPPKSLDRNAFRHARRRRDAYRHHGRVGRSRDHRVAAPAGGMDRRRRRHAQSDLDAHVGGAPCSRAGRDRRRRRLVGRCARSTGLRLSCRANPQGFAAHLPHHDRRAAAADRRHPGAAVADADSCPRHARA